MASNIMSTDCSGSMVDNNNHITMGINNSSSVAEFFAYKTIFLTGATGFVGQALIEKILRSCTNVTKIYCLIREKKGLPAKERLDKTLDNEVYNRLREAQPNFAQKVVAIGGDISLKGLGISESDRAMLCEQVNIVIHSAATVRFDEPLRKAVLMNLCAVQEVIKLCKSIQNLQVLLHISTAYSNAVLSDVEEVFYPSSVKPKQIIDATEWMDDELFERLTPRIIGKMPNTYTFTKQLAETLIKEEAANLPVAIIRPSIITASWQEPYPGWTCSMCGPAGLYVAYGKGFMRVFQCNTDAVSDCIPVDLVVNAVLAATWYTGTHQPDNMNIFNVTTGGTNPHTWEQMRLWGNAQLHREPLEDAIRYPYALFTDNKILVFLRIWFCHWIPAYMGDMLMKIMGKKPKLVRIYDRLHKAMNCLTYFTSRDWNFGCKNLDTLMGYMSHDDQKTFCFDPRILEWPRYFEQYCKGIKHFILHEKPAGIPGAIARNKMLRKIEMCLSAVSVLMCWRLWGRGANIFHIIFSYIKLLTWQTYKVMCRAV